VAVVAAAVVVASCGSSDGAVVTEPDPSTWCDDGLTPLVVAYNADDGEFRWVACTDDPNYHSIFHVADGVVHVAAWRNGAVTEMTALDSETGDVVADAPSPPGADDPPEPYTGGPGRVELEGVTIIGGQDDPVRAIFADGSEGWSQPGVWAYDDVWAIDDGVVFAFEHESSRLVAYEIDSGAVRWSVEGDPYAEGLWPWYAADGRVYTLWSNLQVRSTSDGTLQWRTDYPGGGMGAPGPHMSGVDTDGTSVFVSFTGTPSGGD
jgi:hypothetical protein